MNIYKHDLSHDGQKLVIQDFTGAVMWLYIGNSDGTSLNKLDAQGGREPHWSPNSEEIVFIYSNL